MINFPRQQLLAKIKLTYLEKTSEKVMSDAIIMNVRYTPVKHNNLNEKRPSRYVATLSQIMKYG